MAMGKGVPDIQQGLHENWWGICSQGSDGLFRRIDLTQYTNGEAERKARELNRYFSNKIQYGVCNSRGDVFIVPFEN